MAKLLISPNRVLTEKDVLALPHLQGLHFLTLDGATVDVMIGNDVIKPHKILKEREGNGSQSNVIRTRLERSCRNVKHAIYASKTPKGSGFKFEYYRNFNQQKDKASQIGKRKIWKEICGNT